MLLEIFGVVFGFLYLFLEIKKLKGMWLVGLLMAAVYAVVYWQQGVYATMGFQIYYILVSVYGFIQWKKDDEVVEFALSRSLSPTMVSEYNLKLLDKKLLQKKLKEYIELAGTVSDEE